MQNAPLPNREDLLRERDILNKNVVKADERTKKQIDMVKRQAGVILRDGFCFAWSSMLCTRQETQAMNMQKDITRWKQDLSTWAGNANQMLGFSYLNPVHHLDRMHMIFKSASWSSKSNERSTGLSSHRHVQS